MNYASRTITVTKPSAKFAKRRIKKHRGLHTYWAEIGFILLAVLFLQPQLVQDLIETIATPQSIQANP